MSVFCEVEILFEFKKCHLIIIIFYLKKKKNGRQRDTGNLVSKIHFAILQYTWC